ncbi:MAG: hypothetical protein ABGZ23_24505 [Fuerstiella sp.]
MLLAVPVTLLGVADSSEGICGAGWLKTLMVEQRSRQRNGVGFEPTGDALTPLNAFEV